MELFALVAAYWIMRATGKVDGLTGPGGLFPGIELGPRTAHGAPRRHSERYRPTERVAPRPGPRGRIDRGRNVWAGWTDRARRWSEDWAERLDFDRGGLGGNPDTRPWRRRLRDQRATCPGCGHGGLTPHSAACDCTACLCDLVEGPRGPVPTPVGGDGADTPTPDPIDPDKPVTTEGNPPVSIPTAPSVPIGYPSPPNGATRAPIAPSGSAPAGGGAGALPPLDPSDVRFSDARRYLQFFATAMNTIAEGLTTKDVDTHTLGQLANLRDVAKSTNDQITRIYGHVEEAVNSAAHVAQIDAYKAR